LGIWAPNRPKIYRNCSENTLNEPPFCLWFQCIMGASFMKRTGFPRESKRRTCNRLICNFVVLQAEVPSMRGQYSWDDNYWCWPKDSIYKFTWWTQTPDRSMKHQCIKIYEPRDRLFSIGNYYLCGKKDESAVGKLVALSEISSRFQWSLVTFFIQTYLFYICLPNSRAHPRPGINDWVNHVFAYFLFFLR